MTTPDSPYRAGLPPIPYTMRSLPVVRGYPVPWFVAQINGQYDFRIVDTDKFGPAIMQRRCWLCGQRMGRYMAFVVGPMCALNRTTQEPPAHRICAEFAIQACPFLNQREAERRSKGLPEGVVLPPGEPNLRQPGATLLWVTKSYATFPVDDSFLIRMGDPVHVAWYRDTRAATRAEVLEAIDTGYPFLQALAEPDGPEALADLATAREAALALLPIT